MTRAEIQDRLLMQLRGLKPGLEDVTPATRLDEMGLDSTDIAFWLSDAEGDFDITLDDADLSLLRDATLQDLVDLVARALAGRRS